MANVEASLASQQMGHKNYLMAVDGALAGRAMIIIVRSLAWKINIDIYCRGTRAQAILSINLQVAIALLASLSNKNQHTRARLAFHLCRCLAKSPSHFGLSGELHDGVHPEAYRSGGWQPSPSG